MMERRAMENKLDEIYSSGAKKAPNAHVDFINKRMAWDKMLLHRVINEYRYGRI